MPGATTTKTTKTPEQAMKNRKVLENKRRESDMFIPFIPEKEITLTRAGKLTGSTFSTNALDSLAKYGAMTGLPIQQALGLAAQESTFGTADHGKYHPMKDPKRAAKGLPQGILGSTFISNWSYLNDNPWNDLIGEVDRQSMSNTTGYDLAKSRKVTELGWDYAARKAKQFNTKENVLRHGFKKFQSGTYNLNDANHTRDVLNSGRLAWGSPQIQQWWKESGHKYYDNKK